MKLFCLFIGFFMYSGTSGSSTNFLFYSLVLPINGGSTESNATDTRSTEETNKQIALDFYRKLFIEKKIEVIDKYVDAGPENFIQHNAWLPDGRESLKEAAPKWFSAGPWNTEILRVAADGDLVFIHVKIVSKFLNDILGGKATSVVDIFRLDNGKIIEHWDVIQTLPDESENDHPLF